jgi:curved DNA-binding protein CbpA
VLKKIFFIKYLVERKSYTYFVRQKRKTMTYFQNCSTLQDLKKLYYELVKTHHPDRGGDTATMQAINNEYAFASAKLAKGEHISAEDINSAVESMQAYSDAINAIINIDGITIEIVGAWIWVTGNTYPHRAAFKAAGFYFASKKIAWYFRTDEYKVRSHAKLTLEQIRVKYGSKTISTRPAHNQLDK